MAYSNTTKPNYRHVKETNEVKRGLSENILCPRRLTVEQSSAAWIRRVLCDPGSRRYTAVYMKITCGFEIPKWNDGRRRRRRNGGYRRQQLGKSGARASRFMLEPDLPRCRTRRAAPRTRPFLLF
ncbi:hypothetical protein J6590_034718 [Homalodisca vitripennis]|nr:hypothetical protein J6590_034718 [Homalodisca vitripennis]